MKDFIDKRRVKLLKSREKIENQYKKQLGLIDNYINVLEKSAIAETDEVEAIAFKLYMQLDSVSKVADVINSLDFRIITNSIQGKRKYNSNDITAIITNKDANVEENLKEAVQEIQKMNYGKSGKRWF